MIDRILFDDKSRPRKQQHTAKRIFERLRDEYGFTGGLTIVKDYVAPNLTPATSPCSSAFSSASLMHLCSGIRCNFTPALTISKRGDSYIRRLLIHGARATVARVRSGQMKSAWLSGLLGRRHFNVATVALANKTARVAWAVMSTEQTYRRAA